MAGNKFLHSIHHLPMGLALILKGIDKLPKHPLIGGLMLCFGIVILVYFIHTMRIKKESRIMHILIHVFEALAALFTAYIFWEEGKKYLQYIFLLAAIGFVFSVFVYIRKGHRP